MSNASFQDCYFLIKTYYAGGGLGESGIRYKKAFIEHLPIPIPNKKLNKLTESQIAELYKLNNEELNYINSQ